MKATWKAEKIKSKRVVGKKHKNKKGETIPKRKKGARCTNAYCGTHGLQCGVLTEEERDGVHRVFWAMPTWEQKHTWVQACVDAKKKDDGQGRIRNTWKVKLPDGRAMPVCRVEMASILAVPGSTLYSWLKRKPKIVEKKSKAPKSGPRAPVDDEREMCRQYLARLATVEAHYLRNHPSYREKKFLEPGTSIANLYREYKSEAEGAQRKPISQTSFRYLFTQEKMSVFVPRKDQCEICETAKAGNSTVNIDVHRHQYLAAREEKKQDEERAADHDDTSVWTMDMQAVLLCPKTKASTMYYRTKLKNHNMTFFCRETKDGHCYVWSETDGDISSDAFATIHRRHFYSMLSLPHYENVTELIVWSDGCNYQNRSAQVADSFLDFAVSRGITVTQKFFVRGHTYMECDSMHSCIERRLPEMIYTPRDLVVAMECARRNPRPYVVNKLKYEDFLKARSPVVQSVRPGTKRGSPTVYDLRVLRYQPNGIITVKTDFDGEWAPLPAVHMRGKADRPREYVRMFKEPLAITDEKYRDLQALKKVIPSEHHPFYDNLPHKAGKKSQVEPRPGTSKDSDSL